MRVLVLHGPNLNLLGTREPEIYGRTTLAEINKALGVLAGELSASVDCRQSNHEGVLVDWVQECANGGFDGLLFNFGALTHTSLALADAIRATAVPAVEVHVSNIHAREAFRRVTHTGEVAVGVVTGFGPESYLLGLRGLIARIRPTN
ncbi:MAG: type II 3-dehydroquinate dehydratase [Myxococcota bacterium]